MECFVLRREEKSGVLIRQKGKKYGIHGKCGGYLAGKKMLEALKPEVAEEFEKRFMEQNGDNICACLITKRRLQGKKCNDLVGETASIIESLL